MEFVLSICSKSSVNVIDAKTMSADPVAVVDLPNRVPYGFHAFFVTEVSKILFIKKQFDRRYCFSFNYMVLEVCQPSKASEYNLFLMS